MEQQHNFAEQHSSVNQPISEKPVPIVILESSSHQHKLHVEEETVAGSKKVQTKFDKVIISYIFQE